jgi:ribosomal protein L37AE/L43A
MPSVRCPSCDTAQHVEGGVPGYTCSSCGRDWSFVVCRSCGSRFHARPEATTWTCPKCGLLQEASSEPPPAPPPEPATPQPVLITDAVLDEPQETPGSAFPPGLGFGSDDEGPQDAFAMPVRESGGRPMWIYIAAGVLALVVLIVVFNLVFGGDDAPPPGDTGPVSAEQATTTMCGHVQQMQLFRDSALAAAGDDLKTDVAVLKEAGERETAKQVSAVIAAIEGARDALATQRDTTKPFAKLRKAMADLPC